MHDAGQRLVERPVAAQGQDEVRPGCNRFARQRSRGPRAGRRDGEDPVPVRLERRDDPRGQTPPRPRSLPAQRL